MHAYNFFMSVADSVADITSDGGEMAMVCAWCKTMIREGPGAVSHGMCEDCLAKMNMDIDAESVIV